LSPPVGPTGLPYDCDGADTPSKWRAGATGGGFDTTVEFQGDRRVDVRQASVGAVLGRQLAVRSSLTVAVSAILGGTVESTQKGDVGTGVTGSVSWTYLPLFESESRPFIATSLTFGAATTTAESDDGASYRWSAFDLRLGVMVGKTFFNHLVPFVTGRVFGGPVMWHLGGDAVTGSDTHHYTAGAGLTFRVPGKFSLFAEADPIGERSVSVGGNITF